VRVGGRVTSRGETYRGWMEEFERYCREMWGTDSGCGEMGRAKEDDDTEGRSAVSGYR
jgi:hypothetical protein